MSTHIPPDRKHLAATLRALARPGNHLIGTHAKTQLIAYLEIAEDTITAQAAMLHADAAELANRSRVRTELVDSIAELTHDFERLRNENTTLRQLVSGALIAAELDDGGEGLNIIRQALEKTS